MTKKEIAKALKTLANDNELATETCNSLEDTDTIVRNVSESLRDLAGKLMREAR